MYSQLQLWPLPTALSHCLTLEVMEAGLPHNDKVNFRSCHFIRLNAHPLSEVRTICSGFFQRPVVSEFAIDSLYSKVFARSSGRGGELLSRLQVCNYDGRAKKFNQHSAIDAQHLTPSRKWKQTHRLLLCNLHFRHRERPPTNTTWAIIIMRLAVTLGLNSVCAGVSICAFMSAVKVFIHTSKKESKSVT